jgi:hypothetical protein
MYVLAEAHSTVINRSLTFPRARVMLLQHARQALPHRLLLVLEASCYWLNGAAGEVIEYTHDTWPERYPAFVQTSPASQLDGPTFLGLFEAWIKAGEPRPSLSKKTEQKGSGVSAGSTEPGAINALLNFLTSQEAAAVLTAKGLTPRGGAIGDPLC